MASIPAELLSSAKPSRLILCALGDWAVIVTIWLVAPSTPAWLYPVWLLLLAGRFHALGVVLHDVVHMPVHRKGAALRVLELLAGYPVGSTIDAMRYHHLRHHRSLGLAVDPYLKPWVGRSTIRHWLISVRYFLLTPLWVIRGLYGAVAFYFPALRNSYGRLFLQDRSGEDLAHHPEVITCAREEHWQLLFYLAVAALALFWPHWIVKFYIVPLVLAGYLAGQRLLYEHIQERNESRGVEAIEAYTRNHHTGIMARLLLTPHNVGFHRTHHLHPQAAFENLPRLEQWLQRNRPLNRMLENSQTAQAAVASRQ